MLTIDTKVQVEKDFKEIIDKKYQGDITKALLSFIESERIKELSWQEKFQLQLDHLRQTAKIMGGINDNQIDTAIKRYREKKRKSAKQA